MRRLHILALLASLLFGFEAGAFFVIHVGDDLTKPEMHVPSAGGLRPEPGISPRPVFYTIDTKGSSIAPGAEFAFFRAFQHWNNVSGSTALFIPGGLKKFPPDAEWIAFPDGDNAVIWVEDSWIFGSNIIALTYIMADNATGAIEESDIYLNAQNYSWGVLEGSRDYPGGMVADVENIITHEAGHMLGLGHSQVGQSTMSSSAGLGQTSRRSLHRDDMDGLRYQYPAEYSDYPAPSLWGIRKGNCVFDDNLYSSYIEIDAGAGNQDFCLFGAGFYSSNVAACLKLDGSRVRPNPVSGSSHVSENLVFANLDYSGLATDIYDPSVTNPNGKTGSKFQGIVINQAGNQLPLAEAAADPARVEVGESAALDGSASSDPEGSPLTFEWLTAESPEGADPEFSSPRSSRTRVVLKMPGVYIFYLVVNDGIVDSIAASVTVTAIPEDQDDNNDDKGMFFGCMQMESRSNNKTGTGFNLAIIFIPFLACGFPALISRTLGRRAQYESVSLKS